MLTPAQTVCVLVWYFSNFVFGGHCAEWPEWSRQYLWECWLYVQSLREAICWGCRIIWRPRPSDHLSFRGRRNVTFRLLSRSFQTLTWHLCVYQSKPSCSFPKWNAIKIYITATISKQSVVSFLACPVCNNEFLFPQFYRPRGWKRRGFIVSPCRHRRCETPQPHPMWPEHGWYTTFVTRVRKDHQCQSLSDFESCVVSGTNTALLPAVGRGSPEYFGWTITACARHALERDWHPLLS